MKKAMNPGKVMSMIRPQSIDIHCEIDSFDESFRGELRNEQGTIRSFSGWTEFATALMALARDAMNSNQIQTHKEEKQS